MINNRINLLSIFLGLIISIIILFIGAIVWVSLKSPTITDISLYVGIVLLAMTFFGSIIVGLLCNNDFYEGAINGAFLSLIILVFIGFTLGIIFFVFMGIASSLTSALSSIAPVTSPQATSSQAGPGYFNWINLIEFIIFMVVFFIAGILGGAFGVFLKQGIKKVLKEIRS